jgi:hypothetical protein
LDRDLTYVKFDVPPDPNNILKLNKGDSLCPAEVSEFAISLLVGSLYRAGKCIGMLDIFYFAVCPNTAAESVYNPPKQYIFMEKIDSSVRKSLRCLFETDYDAKPMGPVSGIDDALRASTLNSIIIQIIFNIYSYQENYKIVHGDLHGDNVFLEFVTNDTMWNGKKLIDADYYGFEIPVNKRGGKVTLYTKGGRECPFIAKIGDWGFGCKYSTPKIINKEIFKDGYDQEDGNGPLVPNYYNEVYDLFLIMIDMYTSNKNNVLVNKILCWMFNIPYAQKDTLPVHIDTHTSKTFPGRLKIDKVEHFYGVSPLNLLLNDDVMKDYYVTPPEGSNVIILGSS